MKEKIEVYSPGQQVLVGPIDKQDIKGIILSVNIMPTRVTYNIAWWEGSSRKVEWLTEDEFSVKANTKKTSVGFSTTE